MGAVTVTIDAQHPALAGHFPGAPILPGVLLLDEMVCAVEQDRSHTGTRWRIGAAKFVKPVRPGETLTLEHEPLPNGSIRFHISSAGHPVAHGVLVPAIKEAQASAGPRASGAQWAGAPERGSATLLRIMIFLALRCGRPVAHRILHVIAAYFFAFAPSARRSAREYLRRVLGREPSALDRYRQVFAFASTILDRFYLVRERYGLFEISTEGEELMHDTVARGTGAFLLGAHLGSFEIMSALGRRRTGLRVAMAMYEHNASRVAAFFKAANPASAPEIIALGHLEAMLRIRDCLDQGKFVGMLADRTIADAPAQVVNFLGRAALFPSGPMRAAAALRRPVIFMTGLYRGGNRYHVVFRQIADFSQPAPAGREAAVRDAIAHYVELLQAYCRSDPYNWFNFYDFWHGADALAEAAPRAGA
jgi:predicted LPLAT superfamily acyltransferase/3-hydroxymyristoyl/3-hydroxydecanoyl-(acyl carrier protein) dehydratase